MVFPSFLFRMPMAILFDLPVPPMLYRSSSPSPRQSPGVYAVMYGFPPVVPLVRRMFVSEQVTT